MGPLLSAADVNLLNDHHVQIEIDVDTGYGLIILQNRRLKVSILNSQPADPALPQWQAIQLGEHQMRETAGKVAVMLLKKELLQGEQAQPLNFSIDQPGITRLADQMQIAHEDPVEEKNTRPDFNALIAYLNKKEIKEEPDDINEEQEDKEVKGENLQIHVLENHLEAPLILNPKQDKKQDNLEEEIFIPKEELQLVPGETEVKPLPQLIVEEDLLAVVDNNGEDEDLQELEKKKRQQEHGEILRSEKKGKGKEPKLAAPNVELLFGRASAVFDSKEESPPLSKRFTLPKPMPVFPNLPDLPERISRPVARQLYRPFRHFDLPTSRANIIRNFSRTPHVTPAPLTNGPLKIEVKEVNPYILPGLEAEAMNWELNTAKREAN